MSAQAEGGAGMYLIFLGVGTVIVGVALHKVLPEPPISIRQGSPATAAGFTFALGAGLVSHAMIKHRAAISQLTPLYNMNVLVTVIIGLLLLAESRELVVARLLVVGTVLLISGGLLVASA